MLWGSVPVGKVRSQDQAEGEVGLQWPNGGLSHPVGSSGAGMALQKCPVLRKEMDFGTHCTPEPAILGRGRTLNQAVPCC